MKLLNLKELADELGVKYYYARAMKAAGMPLFGGRTTKQAAMQWLMQNPSFQPSKAKVLTEGESEDRPLETSGKPGGSLLTHG